MPASRGGAVEAHRARHHRVERDSRRARTSSRSTTTTSGATTAPGSEAARDHRARRTRRSLRGHRLVRRRLFLRVGLCQAAALAAAQPAKRAPHGHRARALRHGGGRAVRHHRSGAGAAQRLRHGPQVDVERSARRPAARGVPHRGGSAARGRSRETGRRATPPPTTSPAQLSAEWAEKLGLRAGHPDPRRRVRRALGRHRRGLPHGDVVNVVGTSTCIMAIADEARADPGRVRRGAGLDPSANDRHRSGPLGDRRHLRGHRAARRFDRRATVCTASTATAPGRPACCA